MVKYANIPEILTSYIEEEGEIPLWITVREIRERYMLGRECSSAICGFLHRLETGPFFNYPFIVSRSEREKNSSQSTGATRRYLVQRRDAIPEKKIRIIQNRQSPFACQYFPDKPMRSDAGVSE